MHTQNTTSAEHAGGSASSAPDIAARLAELEAALASARGALDAAERRHSVDLALIGADAIDLEATRPLVESVLSAAPSGADPSAVVADLKRRKPFLFRQRAVTRGAGGGGGSGAASSAAPASTAPAPLETAARQAASSGDRAALLRYLRARRTPAA